MYKELSRFVCRTSVARFVLLPLFVWLSLNTEAAAQNFWQQTNGPYGGNIRDLVINPTTQDIFAGTDGGVFRSTNNGASWTAVNTGLMNTDVRALAINSTGHIFAGIAGSGVFRSMDNGGSWAPVNTGLPNTIFRALVINSTGYIFAGVGGGVFRSTNNGDSWIMVNTGLTSTDVHALAINPTGHIFAGTFNGSVFRSTNNGDGWVAVNIGLTDTYVVAFAINSSGHIFAGTNRGGVFRSTNNGDSWTAVNTGLTNTLVYALAINASGHIFAGTYGGGVFRSTNNGDSWTAVNIGLTNTSVFALAINLSGHIIAGTNSGVFRSTNNGDSWTAVNTGLTNTLVYALAINSSGHIFAGTDGGGVFRSTNDGDSWMAVNTGLTNTVAFALAINSSGHIFAGTNGDGVFRSTNNGDSWAAVNIGLPGTRVVAFAINSSEHIFAGTNGGVFRSTNNGDSWTAANTGLTNTDIRALAINSSGHIFTGTYLSGVFRSTNNGDSWTAVNTGLTNTLVFALAINSSGHIFAGTFGGGVFRSTNNGNSWTAVNTGLTNTTISALAINTSGFIFAGTFSSGVFRSTNNGDSWTAVNTGLTNTGIWSLVINNASGHIFSGTDDGGVFRSVQSTTGSMAHFTAQLNGGQEVPSVSTAATGTGSFRLNASQTELQYNITVCNLSGPITAAHFYNAAAGRNGPVVRDIKASFVGNTASGVWKSTDSFQSLTPALVDSLLSGRIYVNIHTAANVNGEIRGQLNRAEAGFTAMLEAIQEVATVQSSATGTGSFAFNAAKTELTFDLTVCDLPGPIALAGFHRASAGKNGPIVRTIDFAGGNTVSGVWKSADSQSLTSALVDSLLNGKIYVNIHTAANPGGEIRGQLISSSLRTPVPIALARTIPDFTSDVTIEGVITTVDFQLSGASNGEFYLQDATGGIRLFNRGGKIAAAPGTLIRVKNGTIGTDPSGRKNIETVRDSVVVLGAPGLPSPKTTTVDSYLKNRIAFEGQYVGIKKASIAGGTWPAANANSTLTINDGSGSLAMFIDLDTNIDGTAQPVNPFDVFGIATHFNGTPQIQPSLRSDFVESNNQAPSAPTLASPAINAFTNDNTPNLTFNVPEDANGDQLHFQVEIDDDGNFGVGTQIYESKSNASGFSPTPPVAQGSAQMTYTAQTALAEDDWWWRASAWDGKVYGNPSQPRKFIVDVTRPFTSNQDPSRNATGVPINTNIVVHVQDAKSGVRRSSLVMRVNGNSVSPSITGAASDYTLTYDPPVDFGLQEMITVSIDAADSAGNALTADSYTFTTGGNSAPAAPTLVSFATNPFTTNNAPSLTFNVPQDVNGDPLHFRVEIDDDGDFGVVTHTFESRVSTSGFSPTPPVAQGTGQATYNVQSALADDDWWWRVSAWDGRVYGNSPAAKRFVVDVAKPFTSNHDPSDSAKGIAINTNIVAHVQDATSGVKRSSLVMKVNGSAVSPSITGTPADYTLTYDPPNNFGFEQTVNVSIDAQDSTDNALTTDAYIFTIGANSAPSAPTLVATANPFTNDNTPDLAFNVPQDANNDPLHFRVEIDDDGSFNSINYTFESQSRTSGFSPTPPVEPGNGQVTYTVQTTLAEGVWWWRVSAWDGRVYGNPSTARKFIVDISPPQINGPFRISEPRSGQSIAISADNIKDNFAILAARVHYRKGGAPGYTPTIMVNAGGDGYEGTIPDTASTVRGVEYYFVVEDSARNMRTFPLNNPRVIQLTTNNLAFPRTRAKAYRMISVPLKLDDTSVFNVLEEDDLGNYDDTQWRLLRYVNGVNMEYGSPEFANFDFKPGLGFWLITRESKLLDAGAGRSLTTAQSYIINIPPGWSQIGNPFAFTVNWSEVIKGAEVENKLWGYQGTLNEATGYDMNRTQMVPFEGYFVNNKGSSPTTIEILPKAASGGAAAKQLADWKSALRGNEWALQITAACDRYLDKDNYIGYLNDASDEWDANDFSEAPFFDQHVVLYFPHPEWKKYPDLYTGDFRAVKPEGDYWDFFVKSEVAKSEVARSEVVLKLAEVQNVPADWEVILLDKASRVAINFSEKKQYTFPSGNGKTMREFRIVVGKKDFVETNDLNLAGVPQAFALGQNYPNPFWSAATSRSGGNPETRIDYELPITNHVKISVYNLSGQLVRTLFDGEQSAGRYTVSWDGTNALGDRVASGLYLVRMAAGEFIAMKKMILTR